MKRFYKFLMIALAGAIAFGAYSCDNVNMYDMMVTPSTVDVEASYETPTPVRIAVTAGHDWFVQSTADWITVSNITSTGFTLNFETYGPFGEESRSGVVLVSSQIGQWPVVVNQARRDLVLEDWIGTYRIQSTEYNHSGIFSYSSLPTTPTGTTYDYLTTSSYMEAEVGGVVRYLILIESVIIYETEEYDDPAYLILEYIPETGKVFISNLYYGGTAAIPMSEGPTTLLNDMQGLEVTIDPVTRQLTIPSVYEGREVYWHLFYASQVFYGDYVYKDMVITHVDQTPAPAPALNASFSRSSDSDVPAQIRQKSDIKRGI